jgi:chorismate-pyruvate lyase
MRRHSVFESLKVEFKTVRVQALGPILLFNREEYECAGLQKKAPLWCIISKDLLNSGLSS